MYVDQFTDPSMMENHDPVTMALVAGGLSLATGVNSGIKGKQADAKAAPINDRMLADANWQSREQRALYNSFTGPGAARMQNQLTRDANAAGRQLNAVNSRDYNYFRQPNKDFSSARSTLASAKAPARMSLMQIGARTVNLQKSVNLDTSLNLGRVNLNKNLSFAQFKAPALNKYKFDPTKRTLQQTMEETMKMGDRARDTSLEKFGIANASANTALNAMLTARGMGGGGAAAAALQQNSRDQAQQRVELERGLADQAGAALLQAGQFDASNQLQLAGMESQYNLGFNSLNQERALNQFNTNAQWKAEANRQNNEARATQFSLNSNAAATEFSLENQAKLDKANFANQWKSTEFSLNEQSRFNAFNSNLAARDQYFQQGMDRANFSLNKAGAYMALGSAEDNRVMQRNQIGRQLATDSYSLRNSHYQSNYLNPALSLAGSWNPNGIRAGVAGGYGQAAAAGGQGFGAGLGGAASFLMMPGMGAQGGRTAYGQNPGDRRPYR